MQNEKLFKKIKQTAAHASTAPADWDAEKIWAKVEQRRQKHQFSLWRPYAAASAVFILGLLALVSVHMKENSQAQIHKHKVTATVRKANPVQNKALLKGNAAYPKESTSSLAARHERTEIIRKASRQMQMANKTGYETEVKEILPGTDSVHILAGAGTPEQEPVLETAVTTQPHDTLTPLLKMFEHAKRVREERKMIVRLEEKNRSMDLLFFDHPAFIEHHPGSEPRLFLQKR